jgi:exopolysaccharide biosynthesis protein
MRLYGSSTAETAHRLADELAKLGPRSPRIRYVSTEAELREALERATSLDIVYVADGADIEVTAELAALLADCRATLLGQALGSELLLPGLGPETITDELVRSMDPLPTVDDDTLAWSELEELYAGVVYKRGRLSHDGHESEVHVVYAEIGRDDVSLVATAPEDGSQRTSRWARDNDVQIAINGDFFKGGSGYGDWMGDGVRWESDYASWEWAYQNYGSLAFGDGVVSYTHSEHVKTHADAYRAAGFTVDGGYGPGEVGTVDYPDGVTQVISGFSELVIEGRPNVCPSPVGDCFGDRGDLADRHPRTAVGVSGDGRWVVFVVVDGRGRRGSDGVNGQELAGVMHALGAWQAINVDGGGSSTMVTTSATDPGGEVRNAPTDGRERTVLNHVGIRVGAATGSAP